MLPRLWLLVEIKSQSLNEWVSDKVTYWAVLDACLRIVDVRGIMACACAKQWGAHAQGNGLRMCKWGNQGKRVRMRKAIVCAYAKQLVAHAQDKEWCITCNKHWTSMLSYLSYLSVLLDHPVCSEYFYLKMLSKPFMLMKWNQPLKTLENLQCKKESHAV